MKGAFAKIFMLPRRLMLLLLFCSYFFCTGISQTADTIKADQLNNLSKKYWFKNFDSSIYYAQKALQLSQKLNYKKGVAESYRIMGVANMYLRDENVAKQNLLKALALFSLLPNRNGMAATYNNLGVLHNRIADYPVAISYFDSALMLFRKLGNKEGEGSVLNYIGINYQQQGNYQKAIDYCLQSFEIRKKINDHLGVVFSLINVGNMYLDVGQPQTALNFYNQSVSYAHDHSLDSIDYSLNQLGKTYLRLKQYDKAKAYLIRSKNGQRQISDHFSVAELYAETGKLDSAIQLFEISLKEAPEGNYNNRALSLTGLSKVFLKKGEYELAMSYAKRAYEIADSSQNKLTLADAAGVLAKLYKTNGEYEKSIHFFELAHSITDSLTSENYQQKLAFTESKNEIENKQASIKLLSAQKRFQEQKLKQEQFLKNLILIIFVTAIIFSFITIRNINKKRKKIQSQKDQIELQSASIEKSFKELKATQAQLIQQEKMASLGELTAGIAHEIQNPLNFVNNFSEVNKEMIGELKEEINKGNYDEVKIIAGDIEANEEKINHHGRRADAIVKGMLQHSRQTQGVKEPTDINVLCDEYLRLSYHGFRVKDKNFNVTMQTDFDTDIEKINIVPQGIGRVLLNLYNNSFYALNEKSKLTVSDFLPLVSVQTKRGNNKAGSPSIEIKITDNGNGIPQNIIDKIFQPFFTTKPAGQGTGLGLSLSYDIITKEHNGTVKVESREGEGTVFIITLPIT